jgi:2-oxoisovalerate dehydrogenase E1 component
MSASVIRPKWETHSGKHPLGNAKKAAESGLQAAHRFIADPGNRPVIETALRIRAVENALYDLFGKGRLHGTIHTCIGQEFSGAMMGRYIQDEDFVTSNHRCHGHFIAATGQWQALIDELVGNADGVCAGIGSSQHLWGKNFLSNGQQGGLLPVAAGIALDRKTKGTTNVVVSFIGEGTLGEGITYETLNLVSLWGLPHIVICENNFYSQSTSQEFGVAGSIIERAAAFGIPVYTADTWDLPNFDAVLATAIDKARHFRVPSFIALTTYRLNPHSKGDDLRDREEIDWFRRHDPATLAAESVAAFSTKYDEFKAEATEHIALALEKPALSPARYFPDQLPITVDTDPVTWAPVPAIDQDELRIAQQLNSFYRDWMTEHATSFFLGEDIADPYGGAFKISKGLTTAFASRAVTTPISEAAITGIGIGLAVTGRRAFVEIMFGDFITYAFDQIVNNASKMFHMYNRRVDCPVVIRTPMGGRRGYGPTHSQSLERFLIGIDNCCTISLNSLASVKTQLSGLESLRCPVLLLENKSDYTAKTFAPPEGFVVESDGSCLPTLRIVPADHSATITLLAYGGMARFIADGLVEIFERTDCIPELVVPAGLHPLKLDPILESVRRTGRLVIIEEGAGFGSFGAEVAAQLTERGDMSFAFARVSGKAAPIPSAPSLEAAALPSMEEICKAILLIMTRGHDPS